jgi:hypothetical protein
MPDGRYLPLRLALGWVHGDCGPCHDRLPVMQTSRDSLVVAPPEPLAALREGTRMGGGLVGCPQIYEGCLCTSLFLATRRRHGLGTPTIAGGGGWC